MSLGIGVAGEVLERLIEAQQAGTQAHIGIGVELIDGSLDVRQHGIGLSIVAQIAVFFPETLVQKDITGLVNAGDLYTLACQAHLAGGIAGTVTVRRKGNLCDPLSGITGGIPVGQVLSGNIQALLCGSQAALCGFKSQKSWS